MIMKQYKTLLFILFTLSAFSVFPQNSSPQPTKNKVVEVHHQSNLMKREMPYRIIFPAKYNRDKQMRFPVVYLIHGLTGHFNDWTDKTKIAQYAAKYDFIIVMPEGGNGWYSDNVSIPNDKYESYFIKEFINEIDKKYRTISDRKHRAVAGLSMGGYGALKFALKYPDKFILAGSFSGALDAPSRLKNSPNARDSINEVFGDDENQSRKANDIFKLLGEKSAEQLKELPFLYIDCGTEDYLIQTNREFTAILTERKIPHEFRQLPGVHNWIYWDSQVQEFLQVAEKIINQKSQAMAAAAS